jgi:NADH-quinone oxidoreductase subunit I
MSKVEKTVLLVAYALSSPAEAITMVAEERKPEEKHCTEKKKCHYMRSICYVFLGLCEEACPKDATYLTTSKVLVPSSYDREDFIFEKTNW